MRDLKKKLGLKVRTCPSLDKEMSKPFFGHCQPERLSVSIKEIILHVLYCNIFHNNKLNDDLR